MKAWDIDADNIKLENIEDNATFLLYNRQIKEYLQVGENDNKFFIVAPKGFGKTLILKNKSQRYRLKSGYTCIPHNSLCERMVDSVSFFSIKELNKYKDTELWKDIWILCLNTMILLFVDNISNLPTILKDKIGEAKSLSDILHIMLRNRDELDSLIELNSKILNPRVKEIKQQIAVFIDNVDEAFDKFVGNSLKESKEVGKRNQALSHKVWISAQLGIIKAIKNIYISNRHIKIFTSIRKEALITDKAPTSLQTKDYTTILNYTDNELEGIFIKNIQNTDPSDLNSTNAHNPYIKFLGIKKVFYREKKYSENIFNYILRHTFRRPREIVLIGKRLNELTPNQRTLEEIKKIVNKVSHSEVFGQYQKEIIPYCNEQALNFFCKSVEKNVIEKSQVDKINMNVKKQLIRDGSKGIDNIILNLLKMGIIGYLKLNSHKNITQQFMPVGEYLNKDNNELPESSDFFVIHPSLDYRITHHLKMNAVYHNKTNIIGHELPFLLPSNNSIKHIHFGLSLRSICVLIPSLSSKTSLVVIQSPINELYSREKFQNEKKFKLISNNVEVSFDILNDNLESKEIDELIIRWENGHNILVYSKDIEVISKFLAKADSISTSKGNGGFSSTDEDFFVLLGQVDKTKKIDLFAFEKSPVSHKKINEKLKIIAPQINVIRSMIDVYFYEKFFQKENGILTVRIKGETNGTMFFVCETKKVNDRFEKKKCHEIKRNINDKEMDYVVVRYYLLTDIIYFFCKRFFETKIEFSIKKGSRCRTVIELFLKTIVEYIVSRFIPKDDTKTAIDSLFEFGLKTYKKRFFDFPPERQNPRLGGRPLKQLEKRLAQYPDFNLFELLKNISSGLKINQYFETIKDLYVLLELNNKPDPRWKSIFLCYSRDDNEFANKIYYSLKAIGVNVFKYDVDANEGGKDKKIIEKEIEKKDDFLFLLTEKSINNKWCHIEIEMWKSKLTNQDFKLTIVSDDCLIKSKIENKKIELRKTYKANFDEIKKYYSDKKEFCDNINSNDLKVFMNAMRGLVQNMNISPKKD